MAGGTWISQNKVRPGAYINFKAVSTPEIPIGNRGIATVPLDLDWGEEGKLIDLYSTDLLDGKSLAKVGFTADSHDIEARTLKLILSNCYLCKVFRLNKSEEGTAAEATIDKSIKATAKYKGNFGNKIVIVKKPLTEEFFEVTTYADGYEVDTQRIKTVDDLVANDYVIFSKAADPSTDESKEETLTVPLTGGETSDIDKEAKSAEYIKLLKTNQWQTIAVQDKTFNDKAIELVKDFRENEGLYVQAVVNEDDATKADYEGVINVATGAIIDDVSYDAEQFTAWVAGATAGASITESNTGKIVEGATDIVGALDNNEIIEALQNGKFVLSQNQNGSIKVEKDINSLHTYSLERNYEFSKNRVIRVLDEIGTSIRNIWETTYLGKVSNNDAGRTMFKSSIIDYLTNLQNQGAIQDFDSSTVEVEQGNDIDSVLCNIVIKPVDSMEFLYMTVNVTD